MGALAADRIAELLQPYLRLQLETQQYAALSDYLDLLLRWNAKLNLTAVRDPETVVQRHFGESLFLAQHLPEVTTLLDFGSGAGFPGLPIQLVCPNLQVQLAEAHVRKAAFLREAVRRLGLKAEVWAKRAEELLPARRFGIVTMRAVDDSARMLPVARHLVSDGGWLAIFWPASAHDLPEGAWKKVRQLQLPQSTGRVLLLQTPEFHVEQEGE